MKFCNSSSSVQWLSRVQLFVIPWTAACQASLSIASSWSLLKLMSIELVMPSNHLILCHPLLLPPSIFPSIRVFSNESALCIRGPKYWSFKLQHQSFQWIFRTDFLSDGLDGSPCSPKDSQESSPAPLLELEFVEWGRESLSLVGKGGVKGHNVWGLCSIWREKIQFIDSTNPECLLHPGLEVWGYSSDRNKNPHPHRTVGSNGLGERPWPCRRSILTWEGACFLPGMGRVLQRSPPSADTCWKLRPQQFLLCGLSLIRFGYHEY